MDANTIAQIIIIGSKILIGISIAFLLIKELYSYFNGYEHHLFLVFGFMIFTLIGFTFINHYDDIIKHIDMGFLKKIISLIIKVFIFVVILAFLSVRVSRSALVIITIILTIIFFSTITININ